MYSKQQLIVLRDMAKSLGFQDDVEHWENELKKLKNA